MPNIATILKDEIARIARREVRSETEKLKKASAQYRTQIADLKRQVAGLQAELSRMTKAAAQSPVATTPELDIAKVRWSAVKFKAHRTRLDLSAEKFGKLFGVSGQTIYNWEGGARPGDEYLPAIAHLRKLTKRQAHLIVAEAK